MRDYGVMSETYTLPTQEKPNGLCPRCNVSAHFRHRGNYVLVSEADSRSGLQGHELPTEVATILECGGCQRSTLVISSNVYGADGVFTTPIFYYPLPGVGGLSSSVPTAVASCFEEGMLCLAAGSYRAAVVMFRGALAAFVRDKGSLKANAAGNLYLRLEVMSNENHLHPSLKDWATLIRETGNAGAHSEQYEPVTKDQAEAVSSLTRYLIKVEYELPAEIAAAKKVMRI